MLVTEFDYNLPSELIARYPPSDRTSSRMLVVNQHRQSYEEKRFISFPDYLNPGDCLVINNTRVIKARLLGLKETGGRIEALLIEKLPDGSWNSYLKPGNRVKEGMQIEVCESEFSYQIIKENGDGTFQIQFQTENVIELINNHGHVPLPPYIRRNDDEMDEIRYQSVYASVPGAVAAPTAGLHFDRDILETLKKKNVEIVPLTLHVGPGTFKPVSVDKVTDHIMHDEYYSLSDESAKIINDTKRSGGKVVAVGTTTVRVIETCADENGYVKSASGKTGIFLYPPYRPKTVDVLLTNFHLPKSTLIMLVCTFAAKDFIMGAYNYAVQNRFRFYSYGDCMLIM